MTAVTWNENLYMQLSVKRMHFEDNLTQFPWPPLSVFSRCSRWQEQKKSRSCCWWKITSLWSPVYCTLLSLNVFRTKTMWPSFCDHPLPCLLQVTGIEREQVVLPLEDHQFITCGSLSPLKMKIMWPSFCDHPLLSSPGDAGGWHRRGAGGPAAGGPPVRGAAVPGAYQLPAVSGRGARTLHAGGDWATALTAQGDGLWCWLPRNPGAVLCLQWVRVGWFCTVECTSRCAWETLLITYSALSQKFTQRCKEELAWCFLFLHLSPAGSKEEVI